MRLLDHFQQGELGHLQMIGRYLLGSHNYHTEHQRSKTRLAYSRIFRIRE